MKLPKLKGKQFQAKKTFSLREISNGNCLRILELLTVRSVILRLPVSREKISTEA